MISEAPLALRFNRAREPTKGTQNAKNREPIPGQGRLRFLRAGFRRAVAATREIAVLLGMRIERSERGGPGEFDWVDHLNVDELRALAKGELNIEEYRKAPRAVN